MACWSRRFRLPRLRRPRRRNNLELDAHIAFCRLFNPREGFSARLANGAAYEVSPSLDFGQV
jgi:hypothetical protein